MGDWCPRCNKRVYFAEEIRLIGKKWHKLCLKCEKCNKILDSLTSAEHDGKPYCKVCYGKLFGPKGYGFAGGASGLSANSTARYGQKEGMYMFRPLCEEMGNSVWAQLFKECGICESHFAEAQTAPLMPVCGFHWGGTDACLRCGRAVYYAEEVRAMGRKWHKICLSCGNCGKQLDSMTCTDHGGEIFCRSCYGKLFGPKGYGYAGGAVLLTMDTGRPYEITMDNVSHYAQAQAAPVLNGGGSRFVGAEICPRCNQAVYFAEEVRALGKKWHKPCLRCEQCTKGLDSTNVTDHGDEIYCKACYGKLFGPKGYGYAGGASGLSMDTGRRGEICTENVSHIAQAQAAPLINSGRKFGGADICATCGKNVFFAEKIIGAGNTYHKSCFKCTTCRKNLDSTNVTQNEGNVYCKSCYGKSFGPKGFGFGTALTHTE